MFYFLMIMTIFLVLFSLKYQHWLRVLKGADTCTIGASLKTLISFIRLQDLLEPASPVLKSGTVATRLSLLLKKAD